MNFTLNVLLDLLVYFTFSDLELELYLALRREHVLVTGRLDLHH